jgi:formamidopyrimidine-DNA glycosylase
MVRRGLSAALSGRTIVAAGSDSSVRFADAATVAGRTVVEVRRRGKYLLVALDDTTEVVVHLGMTGVLRAHPAGAVIGPVRHERFRWQFDDGGLLTSQDPRGFGRATRVAAGQYGALGTLAKLGPEPDSPEFTDEGFADVVAGRNSPVKALLLDQVAVAGVGNIYADEATFGAFIRPDARRLTRAEARRLAAAVREAIADGLAHGGTTLRDYRTIDGGQGSHQDHLRCYGRAGLPCGRCDTLMERMVVAGRGTTFCPTCQPLRARRFGRLTVGGLRAP